METYLVLGMSPGMGEPKSPDIFAILAILDTLDIFAILIIFPIFDIVSILDIYAFLDVSINFKV